MDRWLRISLLLCAFGFLKELRPSESFVFEFLSGPWRNVTVTQIVQDVFPIGTYSYAAQLVLVFLVTDYFRYKPIIVANGLAGTVVWMLFIWSSSLQALQVLELFYGTYMAADIAYWTYVYAKVDRRHYQKVTSHLRSATQAGRFLAATTAQVAVHYKLLDYLQLNYLSLAAQLSTLALAFMLPSVPKSLYFHRQCPSADLPDLGTSGDAAYQRQPSGALALLWLHFKAAYTNATVVWYSIWYALSVCLYYQITSYVQALWSEVGGPGAILWNGAVEATLTLLGSAVALSAGYVPATYLRMDRLTLGLSLVALVQCGGMLSAANTSSLPVAYAGYIAFGVLHAFAVTLTSAEIAQHISDDSFGLIFGINTLAGLLAQTLLTVAIVDDVGWFALAVRQQFMVYGYGYAILGVAFAGCSLVLWRSGHNPERQPTVTPSEL